MRRARFHLRALGGWMKPLQTRHGRLAGIAAVAVAAGILGMLLLPPPNLQTRSLSLLTSEGHRIAAGVYTAPPADFSSSSESDETMASLGRPGAVLCHGISCSKELMNTLGRDLARHGFVVLAFDYGGHGESETHPLTDAATVADVRAAIDALRAMPDVDPDRVILAGHSMGAISAAQAAAMDPQVRGVVCLGQKGMISGDRPRNLLQAFGLYDQYHTVPSMRSALAESGVEISVREISSLESVSAEAFSRPAHRVLLVSPDADHAGEVYSVRIVRAVRNWALQSVDEPPSAAPSIDAWRVYFEFLFGAGVLAAGVLLVAGSRGRGLRIVWSATPAVATVVVVLTSTEHTAELLSLTLALLYLTLSVGLYCRWRQARGHADAAVSS